PRLVPSAAPPAGRQLVGVPLPADRAARPLRGVLRRRGRDRRAHPQRAGVRLGIPGSARRAQLLAEGVVPELPGELPGALAGAGLGDAAPPQRLPGAGLPRRTEAARGARRPPGALPDLPPRALDRRVLARLEGIDLPSPKSGGRSHLDPPASPAQSARSRYCDWKRSPERTTSTISKPAWAIIGSRIQLKVECSSRMCSSSSARLHSPSMLSPPAEHQVSMRSAASESGKS